MFSVRVSSKDFKDRMDAGFYRPYYLDLSRKLVEMGAESLNSLVTDIKCGPFGGNAIADDLYASTGIIFVRPVNISSNYFDDSNLVLVPEKILANNALKIYHGINLYFGRVGVPCVAIIDGKTSISPNIIIATPDTDKADPQYLYSFLASKYGLGQLQRQLKEVAQPTTSTDAVRELLVLPVNQTVQKYIGNKVRQAETLRARAKELGEKITTYFDELFKGVPTQNPSVLHANVFSGDLTTRINAEYYSEEYRQVERGLKKQFKHLTRIGDVAPVNKEKSKPNGDCVYFEIGDISVSSGKILSGTFYSKGTAPNNAQRQFNHGDIAISTRRPNRGAIAVIEESSLEHYYSVFLVRL